MLQFYFLSVLFNLLIGLILFYVGKNPEKKTVSAKEGEDLSFLDEDFKLEEKSKNPEKRSFFAKFFGTLNVENDSLFYLIIGILSVFVAIIKLLSPVKGIAIFGDLFPAITGILGGGVVLFNYFSENASTEIKLPSFFNKLFVEFQKYIGIACIVVAILHFIIPGALFL